jgi:hypothetical protein
MTLTDGPFGGADGKWYMARAIDPSSGSQRA